MANAKIRVNSQKPTANRIKRNGKISKLKKLLTGINNDRTRSAIKSAKKSNDKITYADKTLIKNKFIDTVLIRDTKLRTEIELSKDTLLTKHGHIKHKNKDNLRLCNNILKSELLIDDNSENRTIVTQKNGFNNNNLIIRNQNGNANNLRSTVRKTNLSARNQNVNEKKITRNSINKKPILVSDQNGNKKKLTTKNSIHKKHNSVSDQNGNEKKLTTKESTIKKPNLIRGKHKVSVKELTTKNCTAKKPKLIINDQSGIEKTLIVKESVAEKPDLIISDKNGNEKDVATEDSTVKKSGTKKCLGKEVKSNKNKQKKSTELKPRKKYLNRRKPKKGLFECDYCGKQFDTKSSIRRHMYIHILFKKYPCKQCKKVFRKQLYLTAHVTRLHPNWERHYMCKICDKPFLLKENLAIHMTSHTTLETMYKCIYCKEKFSQQSDLVKHERKHLVSGRYDCIICEQSYDCRNKLSMHFKSHLRVKDYICQHCGKEFLRLNSMRRHVQVCHGGMRIQCSICKKYLKGHLSEHIRTHEKQRPHKCPDCGQCFTQSTQLTVHRRSHSGARPYPCRICKRPFSHSNALMLHIRRHTGEKPFECAMCPLSFSQLPHMKAHMRKIHGKENPYRCKNCKQFFKLKIDLENHAKTCKIKEKELSFEEKIQASVQVEEEEVVESVMSLSRMRFLLALLLTMIATKEKLKYLGFNKRLIDDILVESLEAMGHTPCKDESLIPLKRLKTNIQTLLNGTVPKDQMAQFRKENKSMEDILELLTTEKK